jgi:hypothetical protein
MLLLTGTATALRMEIVSGSASIGYSSSYIDQNATTGAFVGSQGTLNALITSGDVVLVAAPASGVSRNIKHVTVANQSTSGSSTINIYLFATPNINSLIGTTGTSPFTLGAGEKIMLDECGVWTYYAADGTKK